MMAQAASSTVSHSVLSNQNILDYYKENGKRKCLEYIQDNNIVSFQPSVQAYEYSLNKTLKEVKKYEKGKGRAGMKENYETFLSADFQMPCASTEKRVSHATII